MDLEQIGRAGYIALSVMGTTLIGREIIASFRKPRRKFPTFAEFIKNPFSCPHFDSVIRRFGEELDADTTEVAVILDEIPPERNRERTPLQELIELRVTNERGYVDTASFQLPENSPRHELDRLNDHYFIQERLEDEKWDNSILGGPTSTEPYPSTLHGPVYCPRNDATFGLMKDGPFYENGDRRTNLNNPGQVSRRNYNKHSVLHDLTKKAEAIERHVNRTLFSG